MIVVNNWFIYHISLWSCKKGKNNYARGLSYKWLGTTSPKISFRQLSWTLNVTKMVVISKESHSIDGGVSSILLYISTEVVP